MGRSQETFNKKEKEKKKLRKKQEKQQKREERKANSDKGKDMEDMLAYVDEFGNITSAPPEPGKKKSTVKAEDIEVGHSKQEVDPDDLVRKGTITFFNEEKGYGFIRDHDTQDSVFVHVNGMIDPLGEGDKVTFETEKSPKGLSAIKVRKAS